MKIGSSRAIFLGIVRKWRVALSLGLGLYAFWWFTVGTSCFLRSIPKGHQVQAKVVLVNVYSAQMKHKEIYGRFTSDLGKLGIQMDDRSYYSFQIVECGANSLNTHAPVYSPRLENELKVRLAVGKFFAGLRKENYCRQGDEFAVIAVGQINHNYNPVRLDVWRINQAKKLENTVIGI